MIQRLELVPVWMPIRSDSQRRIHHPVVIGYRSVCGIYTKLVQSLSAGLSSGIFIVAALLDGSTVTSHANRFCRQRIGIGVVMKIKVDVVKGSSIEECQMQSLVLDCSWSCLPQLLLSRDYVGSRSTWLSSLLPSRYTQIMSRLLQIWVDCELNGCGDHRCCSY